MKERENKGMPKYRNFREALKANQQDICSVRGCSKPRHRISKYCTSHSQRRWGYGDPLATRIRQADYKGEVEEVKEVVELNRDHEGVKYGIEFLQRYLENSANGTSCAPHPDIIARLHEAGITGKDILVEAASFYLLQERGRFIKSQTHLVYTIGNKVGLLVRGAALSGKQRREIGAYLTETLGVLFLNIAKACQSRTIEKDKIVHDLCSPLAVR